MCANGECLEVASTGKGVLLRNSSDQGMALTVTCAEWRVFIEGIKAGEFDRVGETEP